MSGYGLTLRGCYLSPQELVRRAIARGEITVAAPSQNTAPPNKGVWTEEARLRHAAAKKLRHEQEIAKRSASARARWTPEKRAEHSARLKAINGGTLQEGAA